MFSKHVLQLLHANTCMPTSIMNRLLWCSQLIHRFSREAPDRVSMRDARQIYCAAQYWHMLKCLQKDSYVLISEGAWQRHYNLYFTGCICLLNVHFKNMEILREIEKTYISM